MPNLHFREDAVSRKLNHVRHPAAGSRQPAQSRRPPDNQRFSTRRQLARRARVTDGGAENKFVFVQLQVEESAAEGENGRGEGATQAE